MQNYQDSKAWLSQLFDMLEAHFGEDVEFTLHDLTREYEHTIVDIRNGHITNREINGTGDILGLEVIRGTNKYGSNYNYITFTQDGKMLRSSTLFLRDENSTPIIAIAINEDITKSVEFERYLQSKNKVASKLDQRPYFGDVNSMLDSLIEAAQLRIGKNTALMTKEDKLEFIRFLDQRGAFLITKSGQRVCSILGISKFTLYNYLDIIR